MNPLPLSDCITSLVDEPTNESFTALVRYFLDARVGLILPDRPDIKPGALATAIDHAAQTTMVRDSNGEMLIKVCADPETFEARFEAGINALLTGREAIELLLKEDQPSGILLCSAASFNSIPIYRDTAAEILRFADGGGDVP